VIAEEEPEEEEHAPKDFKRGPWLDPSNTTYGRGRRLKTFYSQVLDISNGTDDLENIERVFVTLANDEPSNYTEAIKSSNAQEWMRACQDEYYNLMGYGTWQLVKRPTNTNIIGNRWVFRIKRDNLGHIDKYKARLVAQGFSQIPGVDFNETNSPMIRFTSIRFILAIAAQFNLELQQINVKGVYLNGILDETVYMWQPEGFIEKGKESYVCKLEKGIYGLKQSGRLWFQTLKSTLTKLGFKSGTADETVYFHTQKTGDIEIAGWYVNDGLLATKTAESMQKLVKEICSHFHIQDLGEPVRLLGIKIDRNRPNGTIHISQPMFIESIAKHFGISPGRSIKCPMDATINLRKSTDSNDVINIPYASLIGCINYCAVSTRPDIVYATNKCAQFSSHPTNDHWEAAKRIIRYLLYTKDNGILYKKHGKGVQGYAHNLAGFMDADFAGDPDDRKSTTGWIFTYSDTPLSWASKKQTCVL
jgi:Reverse transcriptase (RNA-dependent DNA polymerase)